MMNILARAKLLYDECGLDMNADIAAYAAHGYVFITPNSFLLGKAVNTNVDIHPDHQWKVISPNAWYVSSAVGENGVGEFIKRIPYPLPYVGWMRHLKKKPIKWYDFNRINRRKKL